MLQKIEGAMQNGRSRDTENTGSGHKMKTNNRKIARHKQKRCATRTPPKRQV